MRNTRTTDAQQWKYSHTIQAQHIQHVHNTCTTDANQTTNSRLTHPTHSQKKVKRSPTYGTTLAQKTPNLKHKRQITDV